MKQRVAELKATKGLEVEYITAVPRMARYLEVSARFTACTCNLWRPRTSTSTLSTRYFWT